MSTAQAIIWVVDTSSVIAVRRLENSKKPEIFARMGALIQAGRLVFPKQVVAELERSADPLSPDEQFKWAKSHEAKACEQAPTLDEVKEVLQAVCGQGHRRGGS
jgi:hypothetical protein